MRLTAQVIRQNYRQALTLSCEVVRHKFLHRGYDIESKQELLENLAQSALAHEKIVRLIKTVKFQREDYIPAIRQAIEQVKKDLFLDINKHRFVSLDQVKHFVAESAASQKEPCSSILTAQRSGTIMQLLKSQLSRSSFQFLQKYILSSADNIHLFNRFLPSYSKSAFNKKFITQIDEKIQLLKKLYPDGRITFCSVNDSKSPLSDKQIICIYKNILCGIERFYPVGFLQFEGKYRAAVIIRFLIETYLKEKPQKILAQKDSTFFIKYKIQNIYRLFNYSMNRVLSNAFPAQIKPWMRSRIAENYWENEKNRVAAIRWLVEAKLKLDPEEFKKPIFRRNVFAENGLSYMFARYYNSVSKALQAAYPQLELWEVGNVPKTYWTADNSARAIRRMITRKKWQPAQLPELYKRGHLNRKTFSEAGLATVFELRYAKNIYRALNEAFPGKFEPWEFGNVPSAHWEEKKNIYRASLWLAKQEGIETTQITAAVRSRRLNFNLFKKYSIGAALKKRCRNSLFKLYRPFFLKEHVSIREDLRIQQRIQKLINREKLPPLISFLFFGFYGHLVRQLSNEYIWRLERIQRRRYRYRNISNPE